MMTALFRPSLTAVASTVAFPCQVWAIAPHLMRKYPRVQHWAGYRFHVLGINHAPTHQRHVRPGGPFPSPVPFYLSNRHACPSCSASSGPACDGVSSSDPKTSYSTTRMVEIHSSERLKQLSKLGAINLFCLTSASLLSSCIPVAAGYQLRRIRMDPHPTPFPTKARTTTPAHLKTYQPPSQDPPNTAVA